MESNQRYLFEEWLREHHQQVPILTVSAVDDRYLSPDASRMWQAWQEAWNNRHGAGDAEAWRSIESAPRDGTDILVAGGTYSRGWDTDFKFESVCVAYWHRDHWHGNEANAHDEWNRHSPTHWRPLPAPPNDDAARAGERGVA